ncbi:hypothetical protein EJB05_33858, partial [Eragrostis curvula]
MHTQDSHSSRPPVTHAVTPRLTSDGSSSVAATSPDPTLCDAKTGGEPGIDRRLLLPLLNHAGITPSTVLRSPLPIFVYLRNGKDWGVESRAASYLSEIVRLLSVLTGSVIDLQLYYDRER